MGRDVNYIFGDFGWLWCVIASSSVVTNVTYYMSYHSGEDDDTRGGYACVVEVGILGISVLSSQFCCEPKATLK